MSTTIWRPPPRTLDDVRDPDGDPTYPVHLLDGCETALVLFSAAFWGRQDAWHLAESGLEGTCVDLDWRKLREMAEVYPPDWQFVTADVFDYAHQHEGGWDVVSADPFTNQMDETAAMIDVLCSLADRLVVLGTGRETKVEAPDGWAVTERIKRSAFTGGIYWTVLEPA